MLYKISDCIYFVMSDATTIQISKHTRKKLASVCHKSESYDHLINELLKLKEVPKVDQD